MKKYLNQLMQLAHLTRAESRSLCEALFNSTNDIQIAAVLTALHAKQETADELLGFIDFMQTQMIPVNNVSRAIDIVGTGGDAAHTVNISTAAALLAASCGAPVIKHGSVANTSRSGSANIIEKLGIPLHTTPEQLVECVQKTNFGFCFSGDYHPIMKKLAILRRELGVPTIFNFLGPLLNPARVPYMLCGVYAKKLLPVFADILLKQQHIKHAFVVHGNGLDELNCLGKNEVIEISNGKKQDRVIDPKDYGFDYGVLSDLQGGSVDESHAIMLKVLSGQLTGPLSHTIALNAGVALYLSQMIDTIEAGVAQALMALSKGRAMMLLEQLRNGHA